MAHRDLFQISNAGFGVYISVSIGGMLTYTPLPVRCSRSMTRMEGRTQGSLAEEQVTPPPDFSAGRRANRENSRC